MCILDEQSKTIEEKFEVSTREVKRLRKVIKSHYVTEVWMENTRAKDAEWIALVLLNLHYSSRLKYIYIYYSCFDWTPTRLGYVRFYLHVSALISNSLK